MTSVPSAASSRVRWRDLAMIYALALGVRLAHASFLSRTPFFRGPIIDSLSYHLMAETWAADQPITAPFYQPPLYPAFLSLLYRAGLAPGWGVAIVHALLGALACALIAHVAHRLVPGDVEHRRRASLITGVAAALAGPLVLYDLEMLPPALVGVLFTGALALASGGPPAPRPRDALAGLLLGTAATGWTPILVFAPLLVVLRMRTSVPGAGRRQVALRVAVAAALTLAGILPPLALTAAHNARTGAPGTIVSWNGGLNLWLGNNPNWRDTWRARPGAEFEPQFEAARRAGAITPLEVDAWFSDEALRDASARPGAAVLRTLEKLYYAWHGRELRRNQDFEVLRDASPLLAVLMFELGIFFPFGLIAPLALVGMWRHRRDPLLAALSLSALAYSLVLAVFFVATRYRLPLLLLLLPLAADTALSFARERPRRELAAALVLLVLLNLPNDFTASFRAEPRERVILEARAWRSQGRTDRMLALAEALAARHPRDADVQMLRAEALAGAGRPGEAIEALRIVTVGAPYATTPWVELGRLLRAEGETDEAERALAHALALDPSQPRALTQAALLYLETGRAPHALMLFERLHRSRQGDDRTRALHGRLLIEAGRDADALELLVPVLARNPGDEELRALVERAR